MLYLVACHVLSAVSADSVSGGSAVTRVNIDRDDGHGHRHRAHRDQPQVTLRHLRTGNLIIALCSPLSVFNP